MQPESQSSYSRGKEPDETRITPMDANQFKEVEGLGKAPIHCVHSRNSRLPLLTIQTDLCVKPREPVRVLIVGAFK